MCRFGSYVVGQRCLLWPVHSLGQTLLAFSCFILHSKAKLACYTGNSWLPTFALQSPIMKRTFFFFFFGVSSRRSCRSSTSASSALQVGALTWITMILNGLPWKQTEIILFFLRFHPSTAFWTLVDCEAYLISFKGFLPSVVEIMIIWIKFTYSSPF